ncbi:hypothetical protein Dimus_037599 [Dionaea muscipula]
MLAFNLILKPNSTVPQNFLLFYLLLQPLSTVSFVCNCGLGRWLAAAALCLLTIPNWHHHQLIYGSWPPRLLSSQQLQLHREQARQAALLLASGGARQLGTAALVATEAEDG